MSNIEHDLYVVSPVGGIGNHVRWLLLLDDRFNFSEVEDILLPGWNEVLFNNLKGISWPEFNPNFSQMPQLVKAECKQLIPHEVVTVPKVQNNVNAKTKYILEEIYPMTRSWDNWLSTEMKHRTYLDKCIVFSHDMPSTISSGVVLTINPITAYRHYLKFNTCMNCASKEQFVDTINNHNNYAMTNNHSMIIADADMLYTSILDRNIYLKLINVFGVDDNYDLASIIHRRWYELQILSEQKFVNDITNMYRK
jgi:hypothetical protein